MRYSPLLTDLYELTMLAGYLEEGMAEKQAVFEPWLWGATCAALVEPRSDE